MDTPPSIETINRVNNETQFVTFASKPVYQPTYHWNDDERDTKDYLQYYEDRIGDKSPWVDYIPVYKVLKELYDDEKKALYHYDSLSSDEYEENDYFSEDTNSNGTEDMHLSDDDVIEQPQVQNLTNDKENQDVPEVSTSKFMYT